MKGLLADSVRDGVESLTERRWSLRGLAVTRMILGFIVASQLVGNWADRVYTWGEGARWSDGIRESGRWPDSLTLFAHAGPLGFDLLYAATIVAATCLMIGFATRVSSIATLVLWLMLYMSNPFVGSGGDAVLRMVLLYMCFTEAGRYWSVDARRRARRGRAEPGDEPWFPTLLHNVAVVLIIHQVVMVYVASALWKVQSDRWMDGTAVYYPLQTEAYSPWVGLLDPISSFGPFVYSATWASIAIQLLFPILLLYRPTRFVALVVVTGMHLGIGLLMGIMYFSLVMIAVDVMLISDASYVRAGRTLGRWREAFTPKITRPKSGVG